MNCITLKTRRRRKLKFDENAFHAYPNISVHRGGVEDTKFEAKTKAKDTKKKPEAKAKDRLFKVDPLEAKDKNGRGQGQGPSTQCFYIIVGKFSVIFKRESA